MSALRSERTLFDAAIESARVFNAVAAECAVTSGLLGASAEWSTRDELLRRFRCHPGKAQSFAALLDVLVGESLLERRAIDSGFIYRTRRDGLDGRQRADGTLAVRAPRLDDLTPWFGARHADLIRSSNLALLGDQLQFYRSETTRIRFDRSFLDAWQINLTNPLYEFGRELAVRELVRYGRRFLDLASGLGHGAERLAELCPDGCTIVCVDKSADFIELARAKSYPRADVRFIHQDLNDGLPPLDEGPFDGVLFNGSFHFIRDKRAMLSRLFRALRPGGLLVIGHCFCRSGFADEAMHDLYFSLVADESYIDRFDDLRSLAADSGFRETRQYHRGSHSYLLAEREPLGSGHEA